MKLGSRLGGLGALALLGACGGGGPSMSATAASERAANDGAAPLDPFVPQAAAADAGAREADATTTAITPADLANVKDDTAFAVLAVDGDRLHVVAEPALHAEHPYGHGGPAASAIGGADAFSIAGGCLVAHALIVREIDDDMGPFEDNGQPIFRTDPRYLAAVLARDTASLRSLQRFFAGTDVHDFGMHYAWTNDLGVRVEFENLAPPKDSDRRRMTLLRGGEARRLEWNAKAHWIDKVLAADDGHLFAVGGFMGDATAAIGAIDLDSGAIAVLPGAGVAGVARLDGETFVVLRFDKATRRLCFDRLRSSGEESPIVCLDKTAPARLDKVVVAPGGQVIAAAIAGAKMASDESVVVVDLQAAREIQRVERGALQMAVSPNGQVALQDVGGLEPIRILKDGKLATSVPGVLGRFTASGDFVILDGDALRRKQTCGLVRTIHAEGT